jgi:hypothetical protein
VVERWRGFTFDDVGRWLLGIAGVTLLAGSFWQGRGNFAIGVLLSGVVMFVLATRQVRSVEISPAGARAELEVDADESTRLAQQAEPTDEPAETPGAEDEVSEDIASARLVVARRLASEVLLSPRVVGPLAGCKFHLFLYDQDVDRLLPALEPDDADGSSGWAMGQGATGLAYQGERYVVMTGPDVSNERHGLTQEQQRRYADLQLVAAMPVRNAGGRTIGVLTASTKDPSSQAATDAGYGEHLHLALLMARVLVDLLHWYRDD